LRLLFHHLKYYFSTFSLDASFLFAIKNNSKLSYRNN
jgi:hypothetical protein